MLAAALVAAPAAVTSLHVHEYVEHDHVEHHHGPASHEHQHARRPAVHELDHPAPPVGDGELALESCDPGHHAIAIGMTCAQPPQSDLSLADLDGPVEMAPSVRHRSATGVTDVRVHGPPFDPRIPSRAPPPTDLA